MTYALKLGLLLGTVSAVFAQDAPAPAARHLEFEVASIKPGTNPVTSNGAGSFTFVRTGMRVTGDRVEYTYGSLRDLIRTAYKLKDYQIVAPEWMGSTRFDVEAKMPEGATKEDVPEMLQSLLAARFKVEIHRDSKEHDVYGLVVAKGGPKLKESDPNAPFPALNPADMKGMADAAKKQLSEKTAGANASASGSGTTNSFSFGGGNSKMNMRNQTLPAFADSLGRYVDRPVIDMTGIQGKYDFTLEVSMEDIMQRSGSSMAGDMAKMAAMGGGSGGETSGGASSNSIFTSLAVYGLKLEKRKAPIEMLVIDHAEKSPTEN